MSGLQSAKQDSDTDMETESDTEPSHRPLTTGPDEEGELSELEQDLTPTDPNHALSEEQLY